MKRVAESEARLLTVARALVGWLDPEAVQPLLARKGRSPRQLGPSAMGLLQQILARGGLLQLCRRGGWCRAEHLDGHEVRRGRLWQRHGPKALRFTGATVELLRWLVAQPLGETAVDALELAAPTGLGDQLAFYLGCDLLARCQLGPVLARWDAPRAIPLCWLGFADGLGSRRPPTPAELEPAAWDQLVQRGAAVLEALQLDLRQRWLAMERTKGQLVSLGRMQALGQSQGLVLAAYGAALDRAGRRDLYGFVLQAAGTLMRHRPGPGQWAGSLDTAGSLGDRQQALAAAGALLQALALPRRWVSEARTVRFFDDEYAASQLLLGQWEALGQQGEAHAEQVLQQLSALDAALAPGPARAGPESEVTP